jgi:internalin A
VAMNSLYLSHNQIQDATAIGGLQKLWSLYLDHNQIADLKPLAKLTRLSTLDLRNNRIVDVSPLVGMTELSYLFLENNKIEDIGPLVAMAEKDAQGTKEFVLFWKVYLSGNPLSEKALKEQAPKLQSLGARVTLTSDQKPGEAKSG